MPAWSPPPGYAIKVHLADPAAPAWHFPRQKTMYGGKHVAVGDRIAVFDSENEGGCGLVALGRVTAVEPVAPEPGVARQVPRVSLTVTCEQRATRALGRAQLKPHAAWDDGRPETELNFKLYRQATDKVVGLSASAAAFVETFFR